jgi:acyl-CoA oxidase
VEGDNVVLYLQTARFLIKHFAQAQMGDELPSSVAYLKDKTLLSQPDWYLKDVQLKVYGERAKYATMQASLRLQSLVNEGWQQSDAWNACSVQLVACAQAHSHYFVLKIFADQVSQALQMDDNVAEHRVLKMLLDLFALHGITESPGGFLECGILKPDDLAAIRLQVFNLLKELRPEAVALVDATDIPDKLIGSVLGHYDGDVYKLFYQWAKKSSLNKHDVIDGYDTYLKPLFHGQLVQAKL